MKYVFAMFETFSEVYNVDMVDVAQEMEYCVHYTVLTSAAYSAFYSISCTTSTPQVSNLKISPFSLRPPLYFTRTACSPSLLHIPSSLNLSMPISHSRHPQRLQCLSDIMTTSGHGQKIVTGL